MRILILFCVVFLGSASVRAQAFVSHYEDLPLMEGLQEDTARGTLFDAPEGRFIEAYAQSDTLSAEDVRKFYDSTLPQLGWEKMEGPPSTYEREEETLTLEILQPQAPLVIKFEIK